MAKCTICGKVPHGVNNVPNSMHKTRRMMKPNIQKMAGMKVCTRCARTLRNKGAVTVSVTA